MNERKQIYPLTTLRFFAALCVVLFHSLGGVRLYQYGGVPVFLFFILSGYVLAVAYLEGGRIVNKKRFWIARFARIYPIYFVTLVLDTPNLFHARVLKYGINSALLKTSITFIGNVLMLQHWIPRLHGIDYPNWSLSVEAFFYLLFPFFGAWMWRRRLDFQCLLAAALYLGIFAISFAGKVRGVDAFAYITPVIYLPYFVAGIAFYSIQLRIQKSETRLARWRAIAPWVATVIVVGLALACAVPRNFYSDVFPGLLFLPCLSLLLLCCALGNHTIEALFSKPFLILLGEASYSLYLLHAIVWTWLFGYARLPFNLATFFLYLLTSILLSILSFRYLEGPARRRVLRAWNERNPQPEALEAVAQ